MIKDIAKRKNLIEKRISNSCYEAKISRKNIKILAVSKTFSVNYVMSALELGYINFGENYVDEAIKKIALIRERLEKKKKSEYLVSPTWHFIGPIQSNKTKKIAENFDWVHSVENMKQINRLAKQRPLELDPLKVFIQVNLSKEKSKRGVSEEDLDNVINEVLKHDRLNLRGLMTIPEKTNQENIVRIRFSKLRNLMKLANKKMPKEKAMTELSMGMSSDLEKAILETDKTTYTWIRLGSAIFGSRKTN